jgi:hypothetical protein
MPKLPNITQRSAESDRDAEFLLAEKHDRAMPAAANLDEKNTELSGRLAQMAVLPWAT